MSSQLNTPPSLHAFNYDLLFNDIYCMLISISRTSCRQYCSREEIFFYALNYL